MRARLDGSTRAGWVGRLLVMGVIPLTLACGSSSEPPPKAPAQAPPPAIGGGPPSGMPLGAEVAGPMVGSVGAAVPGLSSAQTATGVGSLLGLAQAKMPADQFGQITKAFPGTNTLISGAQQQGLPTSGLTGLSSLTGVFNKAGISPQQVSQMIPALGSAISKGTSPAVGQAFLAAMK